MHQALRAWSQLRLQRYVTVQGVDIKAMCPLCKSQNGATLAHLARECLTAAEVAKRAEEEAGETARRVTEADFDCPAEARDVELAIRVSAAWQRALEEGVRA